MPGRRDRGGPRLSKEGMPSFTYALTLRVWGAFDPAPLAGLAGGDAPLVHKRGPVPPAVAEAETAVAVDEDYYSQHLVTEGEEDIEDDLYELCRSLEEIRSTGWSLAGTSRAELFVSLRGTRTFGFTVKEDLLSRLGELGLSLSFDIDPGAER